MSPEGETTAESCTDCDQVGSKRGLQAEEAARAFERDLTKLAKEHELALDSAEDAAVTAHQQLIAQAEAELAKLFHETIAQVAKGSIERSRDSAKYVQTAAGALGALYSGVLALVFSVTDNPLPVRGVYAAGFLGLAVALATAYLAFITKPPPPGSYRGESPSPRCS